MARMVVSLTDVDPSSYPNPRLRQGAWYGKRLLDLVVSSLLLVAASPIMAGCALAVAITSPGGILFRQRRVGLDGNMFSMLKFRTMYASIGQLLPADGTLIKTDGDSRITPLGRWLRRTSLDELPQLINVLRGDMSLVGPRPLMPHMLAPFDRLALVRNRVRPGITGLWQIRDRRNDTHVRFMAPHDLEYIRAASPLLDMKILALTAWHLLAERDGR